MESIETVLKVLIVVGLLIMLGGFIMTRMKK